MQSLAFFNNIPRYFGDAALLPLVENGQIHIQDIPFSMRGKDLCLSSVKSDGHSVKFVPMEILLKDPCILKAAIIENENAIQSIPYDLNVSQEELIRTITGLLSILDDQSKSNFFRSFTRKYTEWYSLKDYIEIYKALLASDSNCIVLEPVFTQEMVYAIQKKYIEIGDIPSSLRNKTICLSAITLDLLLFNDIPSELSESEPDIKKILAAMVNKNPYHLKKIPHKFHTLELYTAAVQTDKNTATLEDIFSLNLSRETWIDLCIKHLSFAPYNIRHLKKHFADENNFYTFCLKAIKDNPQVFKYLTPQDFNETQYNQLAIEAVTLNGLILGSIPVEKRNIKLCDLAFKNNVHSAEYIPHQYRSKEIYVKWFKEDSNALLRIQKNLPEYDQICLLGVETNPAIFSSVPEENRTIPMYVIGLNHNCFNLHHFSAINQNKLLHALPNIDDVAILFDYPLDLLKRFLEKTVSESEKPILNNYLKKPSANALEANDTDNTNPWSLVLFRCLEHTVSLINAIPGLKEKTEIESFIPLIPNTVIEQLSLFYTIHKLAAANLLTPQIYLSIFKNSIADRSCPQRGFTENLSEKQKRWNYYSAATEEKISAKIDCNKGLKEIMEFSALTREHIAEQEEERGASGFGKMRRESNRDRYGNSESESVTHANIFESILEVYNSNKNLPSPHRYDCKLPNKYISPSLKHGQIFYLTCDFDPISLSDYQTALDDLDKTIFMECKQSIKEQNQEKSLYLLGKLVFHLIRLYPYLRGTASSVQFFARTMIKNILGKIIGNITMGENLDIPFDVYAHLVDDPDHYATEFANSVKRLFLAG